MIIMLVPREISRKVACVFNGTEMLSTKATTNKNMPSPTLSGNNFSEEKTETPNLWQNQIIQWNFSHPTPLLYHPPHPLYNPPHATPYINWHQSASGSGRSNLYYFPHLPHYDPPHPTPVWPIPPHLCMSPPHPSMTHPTLHDTPHPCMTHPTLHDTLHPCMTHSTLHDPPHLTPSHPWNSFGHKWDRFHGVLHYVSLLVDNINN